jgi:RND family efflux transporter MFP subunit
MKIKCRGVVIGSAVMALLLSLGACGQESQEEAPNTISVETAPVEVMDITKYSSYSGRVEGSLEENVMPKMAGRVILIEVSEGQTVTEGQTLMFIDSENAETAVRQAEAAAASARAAGTANELRRLTALDNYERLQELFDAGAVSKQSLDAARTEYEILSAGAAEAGVAQAQVALNAARNVLADCAVTAPISGTVGRINVAVGAMAGQGPVAVINNTEALKVEVSVGQSDVSAVSAGDAVSVRIGAVGNEAITGVVESVASVADPVSRAYPVKVILPNNPEAQVKSGMFADVMLGTQKRTDVAAIPMEAVLPQNGESIVYAVNGEDRVLALIVQTGLDDGIHIEITDGLRAGQKVVTKGNTLIDENSILNFIDGGAQ